MNTDSNCIVSITEANRNSSEYRLTDRLDGIPKSHGLELINLTGYSCKIHRISL